MDKSVWQKEFNNTMKKRNSYLKQYEKKKDFAPELMSKVPDKLRSTLNTAFVKAFQLIFEKGTFIIEKTYKKDDVQTRYRANKYVAETVNNGKSYRLFSKEADKSNAVNLLVSGVEGVSLGLLGCGIPDIPLFTAVILRNLYEISTSYGYDYTLPEEQYYLLLIIKGAMSYGEEMKSCLAALDVYTQSYTVPTKEDISCLINSTAYVLANEMLFLKFVQGLPVVGVIGGLSDTVFLHRIQKFAKLNYQYRMLHVTKISDNR